MNDDPEITITKSVRSSISIQIKPDGSVLVKAPVFMSTSAIHKFIEERQDWLDKHRKKILDRPKASKKIYKNGEHFMYLGNTVNLKIENVPTIRTQGNTLLFPEFLSFRIETELNNWFIKQAREVITERVKANAATMNTSYKSIAFSDTTSKWGSCTHDNRLQFCWRLIMAPLLVINYVVIHELAHTTHKNHSEDFWRKVRAYNPSYKQQIKWLKTNGELLSL